MRLFLLIAVVTAVVVPAFGQTYWPDLDLETASSDTFFVAPANQPVKIDIRNQPNFFKEVTSDGSYNIGRAEWYLVLSDGNAKFRTVLLAADDRGDREDVSVAINMNEATTVWIYAKVDE